MTDSRVLIVTGGSRGIGAAIARMAGSQHYKVAVSYQRNRDSADQVVKDIQASGGVAIAIGGDMAELEAIRHLFDETERQLGPVTHFINNAGITGLSSRLDAASPETIRSVIDINVTGAILAAREAVQRMSTRHGGKGGVIVNISSAATTIGSPGEYTWYAASKGAIDSFTIGLAKEVADEGMRVVAVAPGLTDTDIHALSSGDPGRVERFTPMIPLKRAGQPQEIAEAVMFMLSDAASYITGTVLRVSGGR
jgi:NAD(P)-dependent dehydrogenase (short-subunit alcohol dehydrogenase family)